MKGPIIAALTGRRDLIWHLFKVSSPQLVEMLGYAGMDFIIVEGEHGACSYGEMKNIVRAGNGVGMSAVVRVPNALDQNILHAGDIGAQGMQIPNLHNAAEAAEAVRKMRYYPKGSRDFAMTTRAADYKNSQAQQVLRSQLIRFRMRFADTRLFPVRSATCSSV